MKIGSYIKQILLDQEKVILPGFGNLVLKESDRELPGSGGKISPPGLFIHFDGTYSKDDEKLAALFASGENIEEEEAKQQVLEFIDEIRFALDKGEKFTIPGVGLFFKDEDQRIRFDIDKDWIFDPDMYGLDPIELLELEEESEENLENKTVQEVYQENIVQGDTRKRGHKWRIIWIVAASLLLILVVLMMIPVDEEGRVGVRIGREGIIIKKPDREQLSTETVQETVKEDNLTVSPEGNKDNEEMQDEPIEEAVAAKKYFIIAGSFNRLQNASDLQDQLRAEGYPSEIIITENRLYRVSLYGYSTKREALEQWQRIIKDKRFENSWVLSN
ncbi:MAG: SPOR domain-containing protein [Bacteroidales bacterium]|nr:SPOR domain-containing protein [Bacteroidales bacterium]